MNTTALEKQTTSSIVQLNNEQITLLKNTIAKDLTDREFELFVAIANRTGLDPFQRQIYAVKRWSSKLKTQVMTIQTGIDGFRVIAERSGEYAGQTPVQWCGDDGIWRDVWLDRSNPRAARVGVIRKDFKEPLYRVARWDSYAQKDKDGKLTDFWVRMPDSQLAKCAESAALRAAFPNWLSGLYTSEEMDQADNEHIPTNLPQITNPISVEESEDIIENARLCEEINAIGIAIYGENAWEHPDTKRKIAEKITDGETGRFYSLSNDELRRVLTGLNEKLAKIEEAKEATPPVTTADQGEPMRRVISDAQRKRLWTIARQYGWSDKEIDMLLENRSLPPSTKDMPLSAYNDFIEGLESKNVLADIREIILTRCSELPLREESPAVTSLEM